jgi:hypothetical protein
MTANHSAPALRPLVARGPTRSPRNCGESASTPTRYAPTWLTTTPSRACGKPQPNCVGHWT